MIGIIFNKLKFILIRKLIPAVLNGLFFLPARRKDTLLLVKCDGIGDYLLFRDYLYFLRASEKYKDHQIYLLANTGSKEIATYLDSKIIDGFYWYSDSFFLKWDLVKLMFRLQLLRPETLVYTNYSRRYIVDELIRNINAKHKIAVDGDLINENAVQKQKADKYYSVLISVNPAPAHEFDRNRQIMEALTGETSMAASAIMNKSDLQIVQNDSVIIFTGAGSIEKKWPASNFNKLCAQLISDLTIKIVVTGGIDEAAEAAVIGEGIPAERLSFRTGLSIIQLCEFIGGAKMLISGDTAAVHIAAALSVPVICIAKGDLYGRFIPYPQHAPGVIHPVFPEGYKEDIRNYTQFSNYTMADVSVNDVYKAAREILTRSGNN
ncbi:glycosyltransferase family 9 protein [Mucilaginibacter flavidus]|uniref:glycosyltransferase family 9 protein n=1 Tax=Mucilaginibacter flavidus TaxID=2949309 RepID=UPI002091FCFB|nr:glycosyltransferase family 9 protein [Mucilaginibacter flavidus]MCO5947669.1 glycosyltransferase family 9 protein [Mucilaginibacter flavidus]